MVIAPAHLSSTSMLALMQRSVIIKVLAAAFVDYAVLYQGHMGREQIQRIDKEKICRLNQTGGLKKWRRNRV
jgi:hypothetical protein